MAESYYTASARCRNCDERRPDTTEREIAGATVILCGRCAINWFVEGGDA
ncbi:hypothetical protein [Haloarcula sebkhae]|uniref:Uncharacterized protein n=1 Tax=Haloarcula sebkhae TaxID=932660 RepID=A0ACC6VLA4_9EURY|nr:hypothetical protein [Haloarcula sebkhae]